MRKVFSVLADSFLIWSRNFTLIYVFFLGLLLLSLMIPQSEAPSMAPRWFLLLAALFMLFSGVMAGWYNMVALACTRFLSRPREVAKRELSILDAFTLFQAFLPGVERFSLPMLGGFLIQWGMLLLLLLPAQPLLVQNLPLLKKFASLDLAARNQAIATLPFPQLQSLGLMSMLMLAGLGVAALFSLMTLLWPAFVVIYRENPLKACYRSIIQFFKDPLRLLGLSLLMLLLWLPLFLLSASVSGLNNFVLSASLELFNLLLFIFGAIVLFVYAIQTLGLPTPEVQNDSSAMKKPKRGGWTDENPTENPHKPSNPDDPNGNH